MSARDEDVRMYLRQLIAKAEADMPDVMFVLIGVGTDRKPQINHNLASPDGCYALMEILVDSRLTGGVTRRETYDKKGS